MILLNADVEVLKERAEKVGTKINVYETEKATHIWLLYNTRIKKMTHWFKNHTNK